MNLRFLQTIVAIAEHPSFIAAANALGLSHSAISLQVKALEEELQLQIVDRSTRPPTLTDAGLGLVEHARRMLKIADDIRALAIDDTFVGTVTIGVVPSALVNLIPPAIARLRQANPKLLVRIRSGLSGDLAQAVRNRDIDLAVVSEPRVLPEGLVSYPICLEPLNVIVPLSIGEAADEDILRAHPFIWFNRRTWAGQQIERHLLDRKIHVQPVMEIDSIEAVESLVAHGLGISITPTRVCSRDGGNQLRRIPFGAPQQHRCLTMITLEKSPRQRLAETLLGKLQQLTAQALVPRP
ncbi:LysR family transcriptional regulator [Mesorhizobium sp. M8A.F.Ca.ET.173.01.1.1]|nr:LysR family transcriptional regulator [Mesorhizobium sp. M8A.F.Ca.ET.173.01.1.1]